MEPRTWLRHLLPLPRRIEITGSQRCAAAAVRIVGPPSVAPALTPTITEALAALRRALGTGDCAAAPPEATAVQVTVELCLSLDDAPAAAELRDLPHPDQSYLMTCPGPDRLVIAAPTAVGLYYGAVTLAQLLAAGRDGDTVTVPRLEVVDGPALQERGLWNFPEPDRWIPWMAGLKLNYGKMADTKLAPVRRDGPSSASFDTDLYRHAAALGVAYVPYIVHLNFLHDVGLFRAWPELAGVGDGALAGRYPAHKEGNQHRCPCASQPKLVDILAEWLASLAAQGADEVSCWLSERPCQCGCPRCTPVGQFLLETRAFLRAWERARGGHPDLRIRIFSSTTTPAQDAAILAELPAEVRFERACATGMERVQREPRDGFANPLLDEAAAAGRWIASYDVPLGAFGHVDTPEVKLPQFGAARVRQYVRQLRDRGYAGAYGMLAWATQARQVCGPAICALAEFSWNPDGRDVTEFAAAWATREGLPDADAVGAWAALLGEVEIDVYDARFPTAWTRGELAELVETGTAPRFGEGAFRYVRSREGFAERRAACTRARGLVARIPDLALATDVVAAYVDLLEAVFDAAHARAHADLARVEDREALAAAADAVDAAAAAQVTAVRAWRAHLGPEPWHHRIHDAIAATQTTAGRITAVLRDRCLY